VSRGTALITGASRGIGLDFAHVLAEHGYDLVLVARSDDELDRIATALAEQHNIAAIPLPAVLRDPAAPDLIWAALTGQHIAIDILINNAGFGLGGPFTRTDGTRELEMIQVNVTALTALTKRFLPSMIARGHGRIVNLASTAAFQPGPLMAVYYATKAYVLSFTEAVAEEVRNTGVTITALCPGPTRTDFARAAGVREVRLFRNPAIMSSRDVAEYGYAAMMRGTRVAIPGTINRLVAFGNRLVPRRLATMLARKAQESR